MQKSAEEAFELQKVSDQSLETASATSKLPRLPARHVPKKNSRVLVPRVSGRGVPASDPALDGRSLKVVDLLDALLESSTNHFAINL